MKLFRSPQDRLIKALKDKLDFLFQDYGYEIIPDHRRKGFYVLDNGKVGFLVYLGHGGSVTMTLIEDYEYIEGFGKNPIAIDLWYVAQCIDPNFSSIPPIRNNIKRAVEYNSNIIKRYLIGILNEGVSALPEEVINRFHKLIGE